MNLETLALVRIPLLLVLAVGLVASLAGGALLWRRRLRQSAAGPRSAHDQQHLRLLVEQLPVIAWSVDRALRIESVAGSGLRTLRLSPGEIVGLTIADLLGDDAVTPRALGLHHRALGGETASDDLSWRGRDFHVRVEPLRSDGGEIVGSVGIALDVTEQRRREASYPETQRLESLGVLAGGIAHDLANLLTGVLGHAELALLQLPLDSPARPHLEQAMEGAHRGGDLTHQLLAYAGRAEARREPVDLGALVRGMGDLLRVSLGGGCELRYEIGDALPAVEADAAQLRQIVMNLITNGAEAIGDGSGAITIATRSRRLRPAELSGYQFGEALATGDYVALRVTDTGTGMSDDVRARIFEPFYSTKRAGRGLGLAAVLGIVREHGGAIRVDSEPGRGTRFEILLPPARQATRLAS